MDTVSRNIEAQINSSIALGYIWKFKLLPLTKLLSNEGPNPFHAIGLFQYPLKISEIYGFLMFSGGMDRFQWHEMGKVYILKIATLKRSDDN